MKKADSLGRFPRRAVLAGLGCGAAGTLMRPLVGRAQAKPAPQRLLMIDRPCGTVPEQWFPTGGVTDWIASPILAEFNALRSDMVVLNGIDCPRDPSWPVNKPASGMLAMVTPPPATEVGWPSTQPGTNTDPNSPAITATDESIDQLLLHHVSALQGDIPSLHLAMARSLSLPSLAAVSYERPAGQALASALASESNPSATLQKLVGALPDPNTTSTLNKGLYDFVAGDLTRLRERAPRSQSRKLDAHIEAIRQLELQLGATSCAVPTLNPLPGANADTTADEAAYIEICKQQTQLISAAFACDLTRVITLTFGSAQTDLRFQAILPPGTVDSGDGLYGLTHDTSATLSHVAIEKFFAATTAQLLLELKNAPDPSGAGSLLDNTLVVYWSETSVSNTHSSQNQPVLVFGAKFLGLQGGSFLQYTNRTMSDFWVATAQAFGYGALTAFGAPEWNKGALPGLYV